MQSPSPAMAAGFSYFGCRHFPEAPRKDNGTIKVLLSARFFAGHSDRNASLNAVPGIKGRRGSALGAVRRISDVHSERGISAPLRLLNWPHAACSPANENGPSHPGPSFHMHSSYLLAAGAAEVAASCILPCMAVLPCMLAPIGIEAASAGAVAAECL